MSEHTAPEGVKTTGAPSLEELAASPGFPGPEALQRGPLAVIECVERIPCNPCETACPHGAISIGNPITGLPVLAVDKCRGCTLCIAACPGLAIYVKDYTWSEERTLITFPYEYLPLPRAGQSIMLVDRSGREICQAEVIRTNTARRNDRTALVTAAFPRRYFFEVVNMKRL